MKPVGVSRKKEEIYERKINELETNSKNKNVRDLYKRQSYPCAFLN
jgi:hypothetical protein